MYIDRTFNEMLETEKIYYDIFFSAIGKIYIFGTEEYIKAIQFLKDRSLISKVASKIKKNRTREISKIFSYLENYFRNDYEKIGSYKISILTSKNPQKKYSMKRTYSEIIHLDLSNYTKKEVIVYESLSKVKTGKTISYKELGEKSGLLKSARFIGNTMAKNNFPIIIPCHRVIKSNGDMGNYSGGVDIKMYLLGLEGK